MNTEWQIGKTLIYGVFECRHCGRIDAFMFPLSKKRKVVHTCSSCKQKDGVLQKLENPMTLLQFQGLFNKESG